MPFPKEKTATPTAICDIRIELLSPDPLSQEPMSSRYLVEVRYSDGTIKERRGNLGPELTSQQVTQLTNFMNSMRTKAVAEFLP